MEDVNLAAQILQTPPLEAERVYCRKNVAADFRSGYQVNPFSTLIGWLSPGTPAAAPSEKKLYLRRNLSLVA